MKVDDEISKSFETIIHLKTQIEEAKRVEEILKNQINEKKESCDNLESEVFDLRKKVDKSNKFLNSSKYWMRYWKVKDHHVINQDLDTKKKIHMLKKAPQRSMR
jgi:FtsZ-binding cell division protein ZapB